jgi:hypothetical protein
MAGIGDGFTQGLSLGIAARDRKKQREQDEARMALEATRYKNQLEAQKTLQDEQLKRHAEERKADREFQAQRDAAQSTARFAEQDKALTADAAREAARLKQRGNEVAMTQIGNTLGSFRKMVDAHKPPMARLVRDVDPNDPTAGKLSYDVPMEEATQPKRAPADPYVSPYAKDISDAEGQIAQNNAALAEGDKHPGWNILTDRKDTVGEQSQRLLRLKALELHDKVSKGLISQEQADAEAERLKKSAGL